MSSSLHLLADLSHVSARQHLQVGGQSAGLQDAAVLLLIVGLPKQDVVAQRGVLNPGLLRDVRHRALESSGRETPSHWGDYGP